ncbi:MAG: hypothetical protein ACYC69_06395 [Thermodesulfovibrionales bacterium]
MGLMITAPGAYYKPGLRIRISLYGQDKDRRGSKEQGCHCPERKEITVACQEKSGE